ncbi:unnamed protein product [Musa textilis]
MKNLPKKRRAANNERSGGHLGGGSKVLSWLTFHAAQHGRRSPRNQPKNRPKQAIFGCASKRRASDERQTASEAAGSTVPVIRKPHPALCHPGGSRVPRWLTFRSAHCGHRSTQKQPKNSPKRAKTGHFWLRERATSGGQHRPCYPKAPSSPVPPGGFQGAEMADVSLRSPRSPQHAKTAQKQPKTGQNRPFWLL